MAYFGAWFEPSEDLKFSRWAREGAQALQGDGVGDGISILNYNSQTGPDGVRRAYGSQAYARLQALKATYDPDNVCHLNHNVEPAELRICRRGREPLGDWVTGQER